MNLDVEKGRLVPNDFGSLRKYCSDKDILYLKNSLRALEAGRPPTFPFPLYGNTSDKVFTDLMTIIRKSTLPRAIIEYEESRLKKVGLQGGTPPWKDLKDLFELYYTAPKPVKYVDPDILAEMKKEYSDLNCRKLNAKDTLYHLKRTDKIETRAAGWNQFSLKKTDDSAQREALRAVNQGWWKYGVGYTFARYNKLKLRLFMPMPFSSMIKQAQYYIPFLGNIQNDLLLHQELSPFICWAEKIGFDNCFEFMEREIQQSGLRNDEVLVYFVNDFEKMDTRTASDQYLKIFLPIIGAAHHSLSEDLINTMLFTTTAPIFSPSGTLVGNHGTASGAEVTNGGENTCNDYFQRRFLKILRELLIKGWRLICRRTNGDDSTLVFAIRTKLCAIEKFKAMLIKALEKACDETGFDIQFDKLDISTDLGKFCQNIYYYDRDSNKLVWMYPLVLVLNSITHPEHQYKPSDWDKDYRDLDIIEKLDNARNHPLYEQFVDYVSKGMKYPLLGRNEQETQRILSKYDRYRALQTLGERYNRQNYKISSSPTVKYILSKR